MLARCAGCFFRSHHMALIRNSIVYVAVNNSHTLYPGVGVHVLLEHENNSLFHL
jgi:hypothetical protein